MKPALAWLWKRWVSVAPSALMAVILIQAGFVLGSEMVPLLGPDAKGQFALVMLATLGCLALFAMLSVHAAEPKVEAETEDASRMQERIDRAYREGFRVWSVLPETRSVEQYLYLAQLRTAGFVISDRSGQIAAIEVGETPMQRRRQFRVVEAMSARSVDR